MKIKHVKAALFSLIALFAIILFHSSCAQNSDFDQNLRSIAKPYSFNLVLWELNNIFSGAFHGGIEITEEEIKTVSDYFAREERIEDLEYSIESIVAGDSQGNTDALQSELERVQQQNAEVAESVEIIMEKQIREVLSQQNIYNPALNLSIGFQPVNFKECL